MNTKKISITTNGLIKFLVLCGIIVVLIIWNTIYSLYLFPGEVICPYDCSFVDLIMFVPKGIKEEFLFRYLPILLATSIYVGIRKFSKKGAKISIIPLILFILAVQIIFSTVHLPLDPLERKVLFDLPPYPTLQELFDEFLLEGIVGIMLCVAYIIYIPRNKPLSLLQLKSFTASCFVHILYNQLLVIFD